MNFKANNSIKKILSKKKHSINSSPKSSKINSNKNLSSPNPLNLFFPVIIKVSSPMPTNHISLISWPPIIHPSVISRTVPSLSTIFIKKINDGRKIFNRKSLKKNNKKFNSNNANFLNAENHFLKKTLKSKAMPISLKIHTLFTMPLTRKVPSLDGLNGFMNISTKDFHSVRKLNSSPQLTKRAKLSQVKWSVKLKID